MAFFDRIIPGSRREKRLFAGVLFFGCAMLLLDQLTKIYFEYHYPLGRCVPIIDGFFDLTHVRNKGAAWSMFAGQRYLLLGIGVAVFAAVVKFFRQLTEGCAERYWAMLLILSGIAGNSIDRFWRGEVVDFLSFHYLDVYYYPVFNVADIAICTGVGIYIISGFCRKETKKKEPSEN